MLQVTKIAKFFATKCMILHPVSFPKYFQINIQVKDQLWNNIWLKKQ